MRVHLAFQLFHQEVLNGLFLYKDGLEMKLRTTEPTGRFVGIMERMIFVMPSRIPFKSLRAQSGSRKYLKEFIVFLRE